MLYTSGLEVITTVDAAWQQEAQNIVRRQLAALNTTGDGNTAPANAHNAAIVAIDPFNGQVLTMLGSPDFFDESIDGAVNAAMAYRQPGSALKPFTYALAMLPDNAEPYTAGTLILDVETPFITQRLESYTPANYALVEHGPVLVRESLASSLNIPAVVTLEHVGVERFIDFLEDTGIENLVDNTDVDLSITLGGGEVRLLDMVQGYSVFSNGGHFVEPTLLLQVSDHTGEVLYEWQPHPLETKVLDERVAYLITDILSDNEARLLGFTRNNPLNIGRPAAAKTGTTTDFRDNWVVGYTPNLVVGVWVGNANNVPMQDVTGVSGAGPIWNLFMRQALLGQPELEFERPEGLVEVEICATSGMLPGALCPLKRIELFIEGTQPNEEDTFYQQFIIDRQTGLLADDATSDDDQVPQTYLILPQEARDWAIRQGIPQPPDAALTMLPDADVGLRLLEPDPYTIFELSPILPIDSQRIRLTVGVRPNTASVEYRMNDTLIGTADAAPWVVWWELEEGVHELIAIATMEDGSTETSEVIPFAVVEYSPFEGPTERLQDLWTSEERRSELVTSP